MTILSAANRNLADALSEGAAAHPDAQVITVSTQRPSTLLLNDVALRGQYFGAHLRAIGIQPGDVVAVQLPAWGEWMIAVSGIIASGAVILPIVSIYGQKELDFILNDAGAKAIVTPAQWRKVDYPALIVSCTQAHALRHHIVIGEGAASQCAAGNGVVQILDWDAMTAPMTIASSVERDADQLALLVYTSGTTSAPKGVQHTARTILSELAIQADNRRSLSVERVLSPWPPGHVAGAIGMIRFLIDGIKLVLMDEWSPDDAARLVAEHQITSMATTPFHLAGLLNAAEAGGHNLSSIESLLTGAAPVPPSLIQRCEAAGLHPFRCYGSSEMPSVTIGSPDDPLEKRLTTEGRPMHGAQIRFVDDDGHDVEEGEIALKGPELFTGYRDAALNAKAFLPDGWFLTGDVGRFDADGYLLITDRKKDIIIRGGENISSREVEDVLSLHPDIAEVAVVAAPDERMGEVVCAFILPRGDAVLSLEDIRAHFAAAGIAKQKTPEQLRIVTDFPRNATGKILKHDLRAQLRG